MADDVSSPIEADGAWLDRVRRAVSLAIARGQAESGPPGEATAPGRAALVQPLPLSVRAARRRYWQDFAADLDLQRHEDACAQVQAVLDRYRFDEIAVGGPSVRPPRPSAASEIEAQIAYLQKFLADAGDDEALAARVRATIERLRGRATAHDEAGAQRKAAFAAATGELAPFASATIRWDERIGYWRSFAADPSLSSEMRDVVEALVDLLTARSRRATPAARSGGLETVSEHKVEHGGADALRALCHDLGAAVDWSPVVDEYEASGLFGSLPEQARVALGSAENCSIFLADPSFYPQLNFAIFRDRRSPDATPVAFALDPYEKLPPRRLSGGLDTIYALNEATQLNLTPQTARRYAAMAMDFVLRRALACEEGAPVATEAAQETPEAFRVDFHVGEADRELGFALRIAREGGRIALWEA